MMQSNQLVLTVGACAHALGTAQQDTHLTGAHLCEQVFFLGFALGVMDVGDFILGDAHTQQLFTNVIIDAECAVAFRCGQVTENHLGGALICGALPDLKHRFCTSRRLAVGVTGKHGIDEPLIQRQLSAIVGNQQHIIHAAVHLTVTHLLRALGKGLHHFLLIL